MKTNRWDCSSLRFAPKFKRDLRKGTQERAFVHSLSSAAIGINIAKKCALGDLGSLCNCKVRPRERHFDTSVSTSLLILFMYKNVLLANQGE